MAGQAVWEPAGRNPHEWDPKTFVKYGRNLLAKVEPGLLRKPLVLAQPEPWAAVRASGALPEDDTTVHMVTDIDHARTRERTDGWSELGATCAVGLGGGMALDHAKFTAWRLKLPLVLVPSILSVDAGFTRAVGVREGDRVKYVGDASTVLRTILIDFDLLQGAPAVLNSAGAGDILSCHTALWDWGRSAKELGEDHDPQLAARVRASCLDRLHAGAAELGAQSEQGLKMLSELFVEEVRLCERWGNARLEEGSEHYVGYALEAKTGKHYIHGQLIGMCVLMVGTYQGFDVAPVAKCLKDLKLDCGFAAVKTSREEVREVLLGMDRYVAQERQLLPGVFHFKGAPNEREADEMLDAVDVHCPPPSA